MFHFFMKYVHDVTMWIPSKIPILYMHVYASYSSQRFLCVCKIEVNMIELFANSTHSIRQPIVYAPFSRRGRLDMELE